jgi:NTP pyrophosphatase (non-canonical NTP hydrolase)
MLLPVVTVRFVCLAALRTPRQIADESLVQDGAMDFSEMQAKARAVRTQYAAMETERYGRAWTREEIMLGFLGDVGDLAKLVQGKEGVRPRDDLDAALAHELADCLWSVITLADVYGVDLAAAFGRTMSELSASLPRT